MCVSETSKAYYQKNKPLLTEKSRSYYQANKSAIQKRTKEWHIARTYGISLKKFRKMLKNQGNKCAICRSPVPDNPKRRWHVDHNHKTGKIRGILCHNCNVALGHFKENKKVMKRAIKYLEKHDA